MTTRFLLALLTAVVALAPASAQPAAQSPAVDWRMSPPGALDSVLPLREQARVFNEILAWRLDNILPAIMRREGVDMWIVMCFEYNEDPAYMRDLLVYELTVDKVMTRRVLSVAPATPMSQLRTVLRDNRISGTPVLNGAELLRIVLPPGVFTVPDLPSIMQTGHGERWRVVEVLERAK